MRLQSRGTVRRPASAHRRSRCGSCSESSRPRSTSRQGLARQSSTTLQRSAPWGPRADRSIHPFERL